MIFALSQPKGKAKAKEKEKTPTPEHSPANPQPSTSGGLLKTITRSVFGGSQANLATSPMPPPPPPPHPLLPPRTAKSNSEEMDDGSEHSDFEVLNEEGLSHTDHISDIFPPPISPSVSRTPSLSPFNLETTTKSVYVTRCALQLNNMPMDQFESKQSVDQAMNDYNRLFLTTGLANSFQSCSITYQQFLNGYFVSAWDLSTSGFVGNSYALPNIKTGTNIVELC